MKNTIPFLGILVLVAILSGCSKSEDVPEPVTETFIFAPSGINQGKIHLPASYSSGDNFPVVYLVDYAERFIDHEVARDEFEQVIQAVEYLPDREALVVTLSDFLDGETEYSEWNTFYALFSQVVSYVDANYKTSSSRTLIGRGEAGGMVLRTLFNEDPSTPLFENLVASDPPVYDIVYIQNLLDQDNLPQNKQTSTRLHYSFSENYQVDRNNQMITSFSAIDYPWFAFESIDYPNKTFEESYPQSFAAGIRFVFGE